MKTIPFVICALILTVSACGSGGDDPSVSDSVGTETTADAPSGQSDDATGFTAEPVQLTVDPRTLVTQEEGEALIGPVGGADGATFDPPTRRMETAHGVLSQQAMGPSPLPARGWERV